jgi:Domain of unknown function (DUF4349)
MLFRNNLRKMRRSRARLAALGVLMVVLGGAACTAAGTLLERGPLASTAPLVAKPAASPAAAPPSVFSAPGASSAPATGEVQRSATSGASAAADTSRSGATPSQANPNPLPDTSAQLLDRMVIRTAQLTVEVQDMEQALAQARAIASRNGGFVSASSTHVEKVNDQDRMVADLTLQVRSQSADAAVSDLRALGKVTSETSGSQDVTEEYVDLDSNLRNLQASEAAILKLLDRASQIQDVLALQRELSTVRGQIERIQGRKTYLERRTDMATITLALRLPPVAGSQPTISGAWDPLAVAQRGWQASLALLRGVAEAVIVAIAFSWWLVPFAAVGVYWWQRHRRAPATAPAPADA